MFAEICPYLTPPGQQAKTFDLLADEFFDPGLVVDVPSSG
jgi:hypothetical protein